MAGEIVKNFEKSFFFRQINSTFAFGFKLGDFFNLNIINIMKKIFVAAAILAMFAAVSCKSNEKKAEEQAPEAPATEAVEAPATVGEQIEAKAGEAAVEAAGAALDAGVEAVKANL